jgi:hypothetical protein
MAVGWPVLFDNVATEARSLIRTQNAGHAADYTAHGTTDDRAHRTRGSLALAGATFNASGHALRRYCHWNECERGYNRRPENLPIHLGTSRLVFE